MPITHCELTCTKLILSCCCFSSTPLFHSYINGRLTTHTSRTASHTSTATHTLTSHTGSALPSVSPINAGIWHAGTQRRVLLVSADRNRKRRAAAIVAWRLTEVTSSFLLLRAWFEAPRFNSSRTGGNTPQYIQGLCQSGPGIADYALLLVAFATTAA
jgi:hypothetical protein